MTRLGQTLLICAALVAPRAARADEAQEDPRAQVNTGFGPLAHAPRARPTLLPPPEVEGPSPAPLAPSPVRAKVPVPWSISMAGAGFGFMTGAVAGFAISKAFTDCSGTFSGFPALQCIGGFARSAAISLSAGVGGAVLGGWASTEIYRSTQASVRVAPAVRQGARGLAVSGTF